MQRGRQLTGLASKHPFHKLQKVADAQPLLSQAQLIILFKPRADLFLRRNNGGVIATAEMLADFAIRRPRVLARQEHGQHSRQELWAALAGA